MVGWAFSFHSLPTDGDCYPPRFALCHRCSQKLMEGEVILILEGEIRPCLKSLGSSYTTFLFGI